MNLWRSKPNRQNEVVLPSNENLNVYGLIKDRIEGACFALMVKIQISFYMNTFLFFFVVHSLPDIAMYKNKGN